MTEHKPGFAVSIEELRELRRAERAPEALRRGLSARLERELAGAARSAAEWGSVAAQPAAATVPLALAPPAARGRRAWRPEPRSMAFGFAAACVLFAVLQARRGALPSGVPSTAVALAPEPSEAGSADRSSLRARELPGSLAEPNVRGASAPLAGASAPAAAARSDTSRSVARREPASGLDAIDPESPPLPGVAAESEAALGPVLDLLADRPVRSVFIPGFAPTTVATVQEQRPPPSSQPNLVTNGDFSRGTALWSVKRWDLSGAPTELAPFDIVEGALCTTIRGGDFALGGWPWRDRSLAPNSFELERGQRYRLSLKAWIKGPLPVAFTIKVGHRDEPYAPSVIASVPVTRVPHSFSATFVPHDDDDEAGLAFVASAIQGRGTRLGSSDLCIDDVTVAREDRPLQ